jgi:hypothetical protein
VRDFSLIVIGLLLGICWGLIGYSASAGDYTIEKVIEIGPADWVPFLWPIKWSPDGTKISYFYNGYLMISDTLGNTRQVWKANTFPHKYEWLSNNEIIMHQRFMPVNRTIVRLSIIDISTGQEQILVDNTPPDSNMLAVQEVETYGPERTVEGNVYYTDEKVAGKSAIIPQSKYLAPGKTLSVAENHILRWGDNGLYMVRAAMQDSTRLSRKPYDYMPLPPIISPDHKYVMVGGTIQRIADSQFIVMDTCITDKPQKTVGCGFIFCSFNPKGNEILFQRGCDDGESYIVRSIGTFVLGTGRIQILDSLIHLTDCATPVYAPDGCKIAFQSNKKIYIIYRGLQ